MPKRKDLQSQGDLPRDQARQADDNSGAEVGLQLRIMTAELHRHLLIQTLHALSGAAAEQGLAVSEGLKDDGDLPPGPWHKGGGAGKTDGGQLPPNPGHLGGAAAQPLAAGVDLRERLAEVELHRDLLIRSLHGVVKATTGKLLPR